MKKWVAAGVTYFWHQRLYSIGPKRFRTDPNWFESVEGKDKTPCNSPLTHGFLFLGHRFRLYRAFNAFFLISGAVLVIRPSFIFDHFTFDDTNQDAITKNFNNSAVVMFNKGISFFNHKRWNWLNLGRYLYFGHKSPQKILKIPLWFKKKYFTWQY